MFSNSLDKIMGGVEVFNRDLELLLKENNIECFTVSKNKYIGNKYTDAIFRVLWLIYLSIFKFNNVKSIVIQHSGFMDMVLNYS